jgi:hypothetical protein
MVEMLDYNLHYALMAAEDRLRDRQGRQNRGRPLRPHRRRFLRSRRPEERR